MVSRGSFLFIFFLLAGVYGAKECPNVLSCSSAAGKADACCVPSPGGLVVFRQRFEPDVGGDEGRWGIDGLEVLDCSSQTTQGLVPHSSTLGHEEIGSFCLRSDVFGGQAGYEQAEGDWAQSEVGEGVEEVWERAWNTAGRYISTLAPSCVPQGQAVASFFHALHKLQSTLPTADLLSNVDITPSDDMTYTLSEIVSALTVQNHQPVVECDNMTLSSVLWPLQVKGSFQSGSFIPSSLFSRKTSCPSEGIRYPPSTTRPPPTTTSHTWDPIYRPTPRPITLSHDESKIYYIPEHEVPQHDPRRLGLFKAGDEEREERKEESPERRYVRDEL